VTEEPQAPRSKRIVLCFDGTANQIGAGNLTNVAKLFEMLEKNDPASQLAYYDPGVGTLAPAAAHSGLPRTLSLLFEQAFGLGLKSNVAEAYRYVMQHWRPGDAIYIFGFSRGADGEPLFSTVRQNSPNQVWDYAVPVAYLGVWDTVKAAGFVRLGSLRWPYTRSLPNVARIRHAVSIDERRRPYREYLVERHPQGLEERWFAGMHADVGGTFMPDHRLATIA
jgi:uncharacterized protein (DUF2235 family)